ncbi:MAG: hypothetical protein GXO86_06565, partial [Chlorobi bacterium]|nr:hypothetical protein [Chlorobiota bacterium]
MKTINKFIIMDTRVKVILLFAVLLVMPAVSFGQGDHNEQVTIVGTYDPSINQAYKINTKPTLPEFNFQTGQFEFQSLDIRQPTRITLKPLKPAAVRVNRKETVYNNYLKAGIGSWLTPMVDFVHGSSKKGNHNLNIRLFHISSYKNIPDYSPSPFSNTLAAVGYDKTSGKTIISLGAKYEMNTNRYYGFNPDTYPFVNKDKLKQMFNLIKGNVGFRSNNKKADKFEYDINLSSYYYFDKYQTTETDVNLDYDLAKAFKVTRKLDYQHLGAEGVINYSINKDTLNRLNNMLATFIPYFKARYGIISFKAGLNFTYLNWDKGHFYFYPILDVNVTLIKEALTLYAGVDGEPVKNSFLKMSTENPWVISVVPVSWQNNQFDVYGGFRGNIARSFGFNLKAGWLKFKNMAFFVNTGDFFGAGPYNKFTVEFDDGSLFTVSGELSYTLKDNLKLWLSGEYNIYSLDTLAQPWHKPLSIITFGGSYLIAKKVFVWTELFSYGKRYALIKTPYPSQGILLEGFFDINLGVTYYITKDLSVFLNGTNLLNWNYERFYNYPVQGLEIMGG